ncbi:hypothetical protein P4H39_29070 [Paenibacillus lautus]|nr:hypothetical protein [Paenibacillus lautus]MEC0206663.1 hypothetical protein [Paenibacillus lautus]
MKKLFISLFTVFFALDANGGPAIEHSPKRIRSDPEDAPGRWHANIRIK